jgi:hypothetical protein
MGLVKEFAVRLTQRMPQRVIGDEEDDEEEDDEDEDEDEVPERLWFEENEGETAFLVRLTRPHFSLID